MFRNIIRVEMGYASSAFGLIAGTICLYFFPVGLPVAIIIFLIGQIFQVFIIFRNFVPKAGLGHAVLSSSLYLLEKIVSSLILMQSTVLMFTIIFGLISWDIYSRLKFKRRMCIYCRHRNGFYCNSRNVHINNPSDATCWEFTKM